LILKHIVDSAAKSWTVTAGDANGASGWKAFKSITFTRGADWVVEPPTQG